MTTREYYRQLFKMTENGIGGRLRTVYSGTGGLISDGIKRSVEELPPGPQSPTLEKEGGSYVALEPVTPPERLFSFGGGHISLPLVEMAAMTGFSVTVIDDRPVFANKARFPWADNVICKPFSEAVSSLKLTPYDYVTVLTRGHRYDADCLRMLYKLAKPAYIGLIGSRRRVRGVFDMLEDEGVSREWLDSIKTPIGLNLGAVTPAEISVSILAELVRTRRMPDDHKAAINDSDLELSVIEYIANNEEPQSIVTVIGTKGSTPRAAGAKMSVNTAGQVTGSIGGGCSEGAIIQTAARIIGTGRYEIVDIDMTGDVAESEGMVCGGIMKVLVEDGMV